MIQCPLCHKHYSQITNSHVLHSHNMNMVEFRKQFPDLKLLSNNNISNLKSSMIKAGIRIKEENKKEYMMNPSYCTICSKLIPYIKKGQVTCGHDCANKLTKHNDHTKQKIKESINKHYSTIPRKQYISTCIVCKKEFGGRPRRTCSRLCLNIVHIRSGEKAGRNSAAKRVLRSSQEIKLFELLCKDYVCYHNIVLKGGWDCDMYIPNLNLAILWNGIWHYQKVTEKHKLLQVQTRDIIKCKNFIEHGINFLMIKDHQNKMTPDIALLRIKDHIEKGNYNVTIF